MYWINSYWISCYKAPTLDSKEVGEECKRLYYNALLSHATP